MFSGRIVENSTHFKHNVVTTGPRASFWYIIWVVFKTFRFWPQITLSDLNSNLQFVRFFLNPRINLMDGARTCPDRFGERDGNKIMPNLGWGQGRGQNIWKTGTGTGTQIRKIGDREGDEDCKIKNGGPGTEIPGTAVPVLCPPLQINYSTLNF